jgi:hypothetical protein
MKALQILWMVYGERLHPEHLCGKTDSGMVMNSWKSPPQQIPCNIAINKNK